MRRVLVLAVVLVAALTVAGGVAVGAQVPDLSAQGPTGLDTEYTAVFRIGDRTIRQFRYEDDGEVDYTFEVTNHGRVPLTLTGLAEDQQPSRLLSYRDLRGSGGSGEVALGAGESATVILTIAMDGCETLSARAGSFATEVTLRARSLGMFDDQVTLQLPEELRTGSPREARCPGSTSTSRPPG